MGRPPLVISTPGRIRLWREQNGSWTARCLYRDIDGRSRLVERARATRGGADRALKEALRDRSRVQPDGDVTPETRVRVVAEQWFADFARRSTSAGTLRLYRGRLDLHVLPALGNLRIQELTVGRIHRYLVRQEPFGV
jgi:integrase-like protein